MTDEQNDSASSLILIMPGGERVFIPAPVTIPGRLRGHVKRPRPGNISGHTEGIGMTDKPQIPPARRGWDTMSLADDLKNWPLTLLPNDPVEHPTPGAPPVTWRAEPDVSTPSAADHPTDDETTR